MAFTVLVLQIVEAMCGREKAVEVLEPCVVLGQEARGNNGWADGTTSRTSWYGKAWIACASCPLIDLFW